MPDSEQTCLLTYGGGLVEVVATTLATQEAECDVVLCPPLSHMFWGSTDVTLATLDGTVLASCYAYAPSSFIATPVDSCTGGAVPALPVGTPLLCHGRTASAGSFSCGSVLGP